MSLKLGVPSSKKVASTPSVTDILTPVVSAPPPVQLKRKYENKRDGNEEEKGHAKSEDTLEGDDDNNNNNNNNDNNHEEGGDEQDDDSTQSKKQKISHDDWVEESIIKTARRLKSSKESTVDSIISIMKNVVTSCLESNRYVQSPYIAKFPGSLLDHRVEVAVRLNRNFDAIGFMAFWKEDELWVVSKPGFFQVQDI